jgi:cbb3-type cytochrome oxidase subunit 3
MNGLPLNEWLGLARFVFLLLLIFFVLMVLWLLRRDAQN